MSPDPRSTEALGTHLLDTGPMLCFGASPPIADLYERFFLSDASVPEAVNAELIRHAGRHIPPGDPHRRASACAAAKGALRRYHHLLEQALPAPPNSDPVLIAALEQLRRRAERRGKTVGVLSNRGEAECIAHAVARGAAIVTNDIDAGKVAGLARRKSETVVDLARRMVAAKADPKSLYRELTRLARTGIDIGDRPPNYLDLIPKR